MHPKSPHFPSQMQLVFPLLETVQQMGGRGRATDVTAALAERLNLAGKVAADEAQAGGSLAETWRKHVAFARLKAVQMGYLASAGRGVWQIPDRAGEAVASAEAGVVVTMVPDADGRLTAASVRIAVSIPRLDTMHTIARGDARDLSFIEDGQVGIVVTSVPYFDLKAYTNTPGQLGLSRSFDAFVREMETSLREMWRVLQPGARACINVGDVLRSRKHHGRHRILPLHAHLLCAGEQAGFDALNSIAWAKIGTMYAETAGNGGLLGQPGQPCHVVPLEHEHILLFRKPGPYRKTTPALAADSALSPEESRRNFSWLWRDIPGAKPRAGGHPAPYPVQLPERLIRSFSYSGDMVLDPFAGSLTTAVAAMRQGRHSVSVEISPDYVEAGLNRLRTAAAAIARGEPHAAI